MTGDDLNGMVIKNRKVKSIEYSSSTRVLAWTSTRGSPMHFQTGTGSQHED